MKEEEDWQLILNQCFCKCYLPNITRAAWRFYGDQEEENRSKLTSSSSRFNTFRGSSKKNGTNPNSKKTFENAPNLPQYSVLDRTWIFQQSLQRSIEKQSCMPEQQANCRTKLIAWPDRSNIRILWRKRKTDSWFWISVSANAICRTRLELLDVSMETKKKRTEQNLRVAAQSFW